MSTVEQADSPETTMPRRLTWHGVYTVAQLELIQRLRSSRWKIVLALWFVGVGVICLLITTATTSMTTTTSSNIVPTGQWIFGLNVYFILFMGLLVTPSLGSTAINGDRNGGTLAILQASLLSSWEIIVGKWLAGWTTSLAFLGASMPYIIWSLAAGGVDILDVVVVLVFMMFILAVVCAVSLFWSAKMVKTATSTLMSYFSVALVSFISLLLFGLGTLVFQHTVTDRQMTPSAYSPTTGDPISCEVSTVYTQDFGMNYLWPLLAVNPFVLVADSSPQPVETLAEETGPLAAVQLGVRYARSNPQDRDWDQAWCNEDGTVVSSAEHSARMENYGDIAGPVWPYGIALYTIFGGLALFGAERRIRTPIATLAKGVRIA
ncbi:ABC transporter permease [Jonesia quinghaiensis]|uniref:ABC transporter permease n=1 Tax=Jonesia quinghaiensis TaxID=262806 RepID=UPI000421255B|nr:ABC transporter permease [Jonesia quinghaiensis]